MDWRKITTEDYNMLCSWWKDWGWTSPPTMDMLPQGYMITKDGIGIYAGFLYYTGTTIAWLEFVVCNKDASIEQRKGCLEKLINVVSTIAKDKGIVSIFTSTNNKAYCNSLIKNNFIIGDSNTFQLIKNL
jgi:hypothetical protein